MTYMYFQYSVITNQSVVNFDLSTDKNDSFAAHMFIMYLRFIAIVII